MAKKKAKKKTVPKPSMFKLTGAHSKMNVDSKKRKLYYFTPKIDIKKATKIAESESADILGVTSSEVSVSKPSLKHDFYCIYDAELMLEFLRLRSQEIGVTDQVKGILVGKDVYAPKKKGEFYSVRVDMVELLEIKRSDGMVLDGRTGGPARAFESLLKGPGKKGASASWLQKNKPSPGKFNSLEKVIKAVSKMAVQKPSGAKRVISHSLTFNKLEGFYVPIYYVKITAGSKTQTLKVNAVDGSVSVAV
ncbi:MAG: hypothetical protein AM325_001580 [Candidatus Thorarchaeota archaeon SMTZ1-45]|nr:MAG: hypothetical protein AM325_03390 [Candidatus Thorarchaeota archaeon SMTZ1-45]